MPGNKVWHALVAVVALTISAAGVVGCTGAGQRVVLTVDVAHPGFSLPPDFLGLSFEASVLDSNLFDPARSNLPSLMRDLGIGRLRFGGNSADRVALWTGDPGAPRASWAQSLVTASDLARLGALAAATGWKVDLGLTLGHPDPQAAADETAAAVHLIGGGLGTVQIGNEPDLLGNVRPGYRAAGYRVDAAAYRAAIAAVAPSARISGPDTALVTSLRTYGAAAGAPAFLTQHFYPLTRCGGGRPTIGELLSGSTLQAETNVAAGAVAIGRAMGLAVRLDETNSASCGGQDGVSNTLASALWIVEYLVTAAQHHVDGVGIQGGLAACRGYTPLCVPGAEGAAAGTAPGIDAVADTSLGAAAAAGGRLAVQPDFYGLLLVHQLEGGRWLPSRSSRPTTAWEAAVKMPDGAVRVVVVNPSPDAAADVTVRASGYRGPASVQWLTGPSLAATSAVRLGGAALEADGTWRPVDQAMAGRADGLHVRVPAATAALVTLPRRGGGGGDG